MTLCLVGTGSDGRSRSFDVMPISRPDDLGEIAKRVLTEVYTTVSILRYARIKVVGTTSFAAFTTSQSRRLGWW
jgi:hypothetical protein